jgi:hypothetical protein
MWDGMDAFWRRSGEVFWHLVYTGLLFIGVGWIIIWQILIWCRRRLVIRQAMLCHGLRLLSSVGIGAVG